MIKKQIPNLFTLANACCGMLATVSILQNRDLSTAAYLLVLAAVFDFFDGFLARKLGVDGELGKQLDSLADCITFGLVPALMGYRIIALICDSFEPAILLAGAEYVYPYAWLRYVPLIILPFSIYRLGKFNIDTRQSKSFLGLATPANAMFWASLCIIDNPIISERAHTRYLYEDVDYATNMEMLFANPILLAVYAVVLSLLLVSEIPLFAFKFEQKGWKGNEVKFIFMLAAIAGLFCAYSFGYSGFITVPFLLLLYIVLSIIDNIRTRNKNEIRSAH